MNQESYSAKLERIPPGDLSQRDWEIKTLGLMSAHVYSAYIAKGEELDILPRIDFSNTRSPWIKNYWAKIYEVEKQFDQSEEEEIPVAYAALKSTFFQEAVADIKKGNRHYILEELVHLTNNNREQLSDKAIGVLHHNAMALYLLLCSPSRFLVGTKEGLHWKRINWPDEALNDRDFLLKVRNYASVYLPNLHNIGRREAEIVPDPMQEEELVDLNVPKPARSTEELLESAYYGQRFMIPFEGAEVRFRKAGDIEKVLVSQNKKGVLGTFFTEKGQEIVGVDLDNVQGTGFRMLGYNLAVNDIDLNLANILAEVYHDIVTAEEVPTTRFKQLRKHGRQIQPNEEVSITEEPEVIYIPRHIRRGNEPEVRVPYDGPQRPTTPHRVSGHLRHASMTESHRLELLKFEQQHDISILKHVPAGYTFVRPFVVPEGWENIRGIPTFIKRRIETQLQQNIERQISLVS